MTRGIGTDIEALKAMLVLAPDIAIKTHPIRFGSVTWTTVTGVMTGTFTRPMTLPDGKAIPPSGERFAIAMATVGHWKDGIMGDAWLFRDTQDFMKQLGLGAG